MTDDFQGSQNVIEAAMRLAANRSWGEIRMTDIAQEANVTLASLSAVASSRTEVLALFARHVDRLMLESLGRDPVSGDAHDRLFEVIMRRLEVMAPYRAAIANILRSPGSDPADLPRLAAMMAETQGWVLAAAGLEDTGLREGVKRLGLASVYARTLRVWAEDDDPGQARTMAALDKALRDGAATLKRVEPALSLVASFGSLARGLWQSRRRSASKTAPEAPPRDEAPEPPREAAE